MAFHPTNSERTITVMDINSLLAGVDSPKLRASLAQLLNGPQGRELQQKLKNVDKTQLRDYVNTINTNQISTQAVLNQIQNNPNLVKQLNQLLSKQ
jgi:hypothetical protein